MHATTRTTGLSLAVALLAVLLVPTAALADGPVQMKRRTVQIILDDPDPVGRLIRDRKGEDPRSEQPMTPHAPLPVTAPAPDPGVTLAWWMRQALCMRPGAPAALCTIEELVTPPRRRR